MPEREDIVNCAGMYGPILWVRAKTLTLELDHPGTNCIVQAYGSKHRCARYLQNKRMRNFVVLSLCVFY